MATRDEKLRVMGELLNRIQSHSTINTLVETGTLHAGFTLLARALFDNVYTIERSSELHRSAVEKWGHTRIRFLRGDSRQVLPKLTDLLSEPCVWYLDAHALPSGGGAGANDLPLMEELAILKPRPQPDLIVIDDVHAFGKTFDRDDWSGVTRETILQSVDRVCHDEVLGDMFALWRHASVDRATAAD
jgi:hypothetical protein